MKNKILIIATLAGSLVLSSCEDFLTHDNTTSANQETFFDTDEALEAATAPLYNYVWNSFNDKAYYSMGDGRANNITARWSDYIYPYTNFTETALSPGLEDAWGSFYSVVAQSNYAINNIKDYSGPQVSEKAKVQAYAEARFMRGLAYWYIGSLWNKGIIYENTAEQVNNSVVPANRGVDVIEFAIRDLEYAAVNLSKTASDVGRVTCYSAYAILSRMYLSMAGLTTEGEYNGSNIATDFNRGSRNTYYLDMARKAATKVIEEGPYSLLDNYGDLFAPSTCNNNSEAIFQLQWLQGSTDAIGWGCNNSISTYFGWSTMVSEHRLRQRFAGQNLPYAVGHSHPSPCVAPGLPAGQGSGRTLLRHGPRRKTGRLNTIDHGKNRSEPDRLRPDEGSAARRPKRTNLRPGTEYAALLPQRQRHHAAAPAPRGSATRSGGDGRNRTRQFRRTPHHSGDSGRGHAARRRQPYHGNDAPGQGLWSCGL